MLVFNSLIEKIKNVSPDLDVVEFTLFYEDVGDALQCVKPNITVKFQRKGKTND